MNLHGPVIGRVGNGHWTYDDFGLGRCAPVTANLTRHQPKIGGIRTEADRLSVARARRTAPISVRVNGTEYSLGEISMSWLHQQIDERRRVGEPVCVVVSARSDSIAVTLATPGCSSGAGGTRPPNRLESEVLSRWRELVLKKEDFTAGNLWAFLQYLERQV